MKQRIVITGVAGFIGSNLAHRLLEEGYSVLGIDNLSYGVREQIPDGIEFCREDIRSPNLARLIQENDVIFHLAAKNCISDCQKKPLETVDINVTGTVNVFEVALQKKAKKVIYAESSALYEGCHQFPTPESKVSPQSFYALSKFASMILGEGYRRFYGLKTTALRYFNVYGPRQDYRRTIPPLMSAFILNLLRGQRPIIYGTGNKKRDFIYVEDVNDFHLLCLQDSRTEGRVFNLGSGINYSVNEIYAAIEELIKNGLRPVYQKDLPGEAEETLADISQAKGLGWVPKVSLQKGLHQSIVYIKNHVLNQ